MGYAPHNRCPSHAPPHRHTLEVFDHVIWRTEDLYGPEGSLDMRRIIWAGSAVRVVAVDVHSSFVRRRLVRHVGK